MQVSVVIPTYNRVKDLDRCLDSIVVQTKLPKEVLVIDNGTDTRTRDLIERRKREFEERGMILNYIKNEIENSLTVRAQGFWKNQQKNNRREKQLL